MKIALVLTLYGLNTEEENKSYKYIYLFKDLDLTFVPFIGIKLQFNCINTGHENSFAFSQSMQNAPALASGIFTIKKVIYHIDNNEFKIDAEEGYDTEAEMISVAEQYVLGYGFQRSY